MGEEGAYHQLCITRAAPCWIALAESMTGRRWRSVGRSARRTAAKKERRRDYSDDGGAAARWLAEIDFVVGPGRRGSVSGGTPGRVGLYGDLRFAGRS